MPPKKKKKDMEEIVKIDNKTIKMKGNLLSCGNEKFMNVLSKKYGNAHMIPMKLIICTCKSKTKKNTMKIFFLEYEKPKDLKETLITITGSKRILKKDIEYLQEAFKKVKKEIVW